MPFPNLVDFTIVWAMALRPLLSHLLEQSCARQRSLETLIQLQGTKNSYLYFQVYDLFYDHAVVIHLTEEVMIDIGAILEIQLRLHFLSL